MCIFSINYVSSNSECSIYRMVWTFFNKFFRSETTTNGFVVPGNATILDGWVNVGVDGMIDADYGLYYNSLGTDFSNGSLEGTTLDHYGDILSLAPILSLIKKQILNLV